MKMDREYDVRWRCWAWSDQPDTHSRPFKSRAEVAVPVGSEVAACVVWQQAANNDCGAGLWTEDDVVVEILEPAEFAGHYRVAIEVKCTTRGIEMTADEVRAEYADMA